MTNSRSVGRLVADLPFPLKRPSHPAVGEGGLVSGGLRQPYIVCIHIYGCIHSSCVTGLLPLQQVPLIADYFAQEEEYQNERVRALSAQLEEWKAVARESLEEMQKMAEEMRGNDNDLERELSQK